MAVTQVFEFSDYKRLLKDRIHLNREVYGYKTRLARAAGCQKSFLSTVLNGGAHLTLEHAVGLSAFFGLDGVAREYFIELVARDRAGTRELRAYHDARLSRMRREFENAGRYESERSIVGETGSETLEYYSSWHFSAVHILLTIPEFRTEAAIAERLALPRLAVAETLAKLEGFGVARRSGPGWVATEKRLHMPKASFMNSVQNQQWRTRAQLDELKRPAESIHYTGIYSLSREDISRLRQAMFRAIEQSREIVGPSREEELVCFACDLFVV